MTAPGTTPPDQPEEHRAVLERVRQDVADTAVVPDWQARAEAAEARLAKLRSVLLEGGQSDTTARRRALAVIVSEEGSDA